MGLAEIIENMQTALTVEQLAGLLSCSPKTLYKQIRAKRLPAFRVGSAIRLEPEATAAWLRSKMGRK
jgi:excisionase family DNA binding protein